MGTKAQRPHPANLARAGERWFAADRPESLAWIVGHQRFSLRGGF